MRAELTVKNGKLEIITDEPVYGVNSLEIIQMAKTCDVIDLAFKANSCFYFKDHELLDATQLKILIKGRLLQFANGLTKIAQSLETENKKWK